MKFSLSWLKEHIETTASLSEITSKLTMIGHEVEKITDRSIGLEKFKVAKVISATQHPNADRLKVCEIDDGSNIYSVVCGAPNARAGIKGVFAESGSYIPGTDLLLKVSDIRGVSSNGMLLSERELGISDEHAGIIELEESAPVGAKAVRVMKLDDPVIEVAITPNRGDCLGVRGIARDLAASGLGKLTPLKYNPVKGVFKSPIDIKLNLPKKDKRLCPYFVGRYIRDVQNTDSPDWLKEKLLAIGLRPISALVDITNLMTFEFGRPFHVFDTKFLDGNIDVRLASKGEKILALNGKEYELDEKMCVIADDTGVQSIGGIIGGELSGCSYDTRDIFLECAYFDPVSTAKTGRKLQINSDARFRFERGVDPAFLIKASEIATQLIIDLCGGQASEIIESGNEPEWEQRLILHPNRVKLLTGVEINEEQITNILTNLGFMVEKHNSQFSVTVPSWRRDIIDEPCLVEEIVRIFGFEKIPSTPIILTKMFQEIPMEPIQKRHMHVRRILAQQGLVETVTYSFMSSNDAELFGEIKPELRLVNPISTDLNVMRPSILPNLINAAKRNSDHANEGIALFELGPQFHDDTPEGELIVASGLRAGTIGERHWLEPRRQVDAYDAKADILNVLREVWGKTEQLQVRKGAPSWYHPGKSGVIQLGPKNILGFFGEINPKVLQKINAVGPISAFELFIGNIPLPKTEKSATKPHLELPQFHKVDRDFCFIVKQEVNASDIIFAAKESDKNLISQVRLFDVFAGGSIVGGKKSIAINVTLQPKAKTLTDKEIDGISNSIVQNVNRRTGGVLRD